MKYPYIVLEELKRFDEKVLDTRNARNEEIIQKKQDYEPHYSISLKRL